MVVLKHIKSQVVSLQAFAPNISDETAYVINRMLHKDPAERYQSYAELLVHLRYARQQLRKRQAGPRARKRGKFSPEQVFLPALWTAAAVASFVVVVWFFGLRTHFVGAPSEGRATVLDAR